MVRNLELVRKILLEVQSMPAGSPPVHIEFEGEYKQDEVNEHIDLLIKANLLEGKVQRSTEKIVMVVVRGLTWDGHDFISAAAKDSIWQRALAVAKEKGLAITFDVLKELLKSYVRQEAGLP